MWDSNGDSSKLLKICISHKPMFFRCTPSAVQIQNNRNWWNVGILTFPTGLSLVLNFDVSDPPSVRTAAADILKHVQVPGQIDGLTAERPGQLLPTNGSSYPSYAEKAEGNGCWGVARMVCTYSMR